jgi:hypothetical protein
VEHVQFPVAGAGSWCAKMGQYSICACLNGDCMKLTEW